MTFKVNFGANYASFDLTMKGNDVNTDIGFKAVQPASDFVLQTDDTLIYENGILSVNTADAVEKDNSLPITSAAVYTEVGNINALLETI